MESDLTEERLEEEIKKEEKHTRFGFLITGTVVVFLIINLVYLNIFIFSQQTISDVAKQPSSVSTVITPTETPTPTPTIKPTIIPTAVIQNTAVKEYFVSLGSGNSQATDWADIPGMQATADFGQYSKIKEVRFEASVYVPTGNQSVSVRLFNVTDKHPVWYSEVNMSGGTSAYLTSSPVIYDLGSKLYQVQIKTQLGAPTNLVQARLHIILQ